jgi:hypothetical protein
MKQTLAIPHHQPVERERGPYRQLALAALLALIIGAVGLAIETPINTAWAALSSETAAAEPLPTYPTRVLSEEWRGYGYRQPVQYERMYRKDPTPRRRDWIR